MAEEHMIKNMETWVAEHKDTVFRYLVYRKIWTPYEMDEKFSDESEYTSNLYDFGKIVDAIYLGNGKWFVGLSAVDSETKEEISPKRIEYYNLDEIRLCVFENDEETDDEEDDWCF